MAEYALTDPSVAVNNNDIAIIPNTCKYTEGEGETSVRATSGGGGATVMVISEDITQKIGKISFELANTIENIKLAREWKKNPGVNFVEVSATLKGEAFQRIFNQASVTNDYEVMLQHEGNIPLEWESEQP